MPNELVVTFEGDYVQVVSNGDKDWSHIVRLWKQTVALCREHECYRVLGVARSTRPVGTLDAFDHAALFQELGIDRRYRIAWAELSPDAIDRQRFVETVLSNRSLPGRVFSSVEEARRWLLEPEAASA